MLVPTKAIVMSMYRARRMIAPAAAAWLAIILPAQAQNARVYVANSSNSRVLQVQFNPISTHVVIDDPNLLTQVRDLAIRDDGLNGTNLIVSDRNGGRIAFYQNAAGTGQLIFDANVIDGPRRPDGMSLDLAGNLFVMNSGQGSSAGVSQVWVVRRDTACPGGAHCLPGGYGAPLGLIDPNVRIPTLVGGVPALMVAELLPESHVVRSGAGLLHAGDLLVVTNPGAVVRYQAAQIGAFLAALAAGQSPAALTPDTVIYPAGASVPGDRQFPAGSVPNGMAFGPNGDLLIPVSDGRILTYGPDGRRRSNGAGGFVDFTAGSGQDNFKIAVGLQDGQNRAFVTHQQRGELHRFAIAPDGTGVLDAVVPGLQVPVGVDASNSNTVPAPAGSNVTVAPTDVLSSRIEQVLLPGLVNARVSTFPDPRESEQSVPPNLPLHRSLFLNELRADLPAIEIPAYARAFRLGDPNTGTPSFILVEASTNVVVSGLLDHLAIETPILGYAPDCADPDHTRLPFMFWSPDANDAPIVEGARFIDVTTGCGSIRGITRDMSYFLTGVRITEPLPDLVRQKLDGLRQVISGSSCITSQVSRRLLNLMDRADRDFARAHYTDVVSDLQAIETQVVQAPQAFSDCAGNTAGEIRARVRSAVFVLGKL
jgi:hypothetical protein